MKETVWYVSLSTSNSKGHYNVYFQCSSNILDKHLQAAYAEKWNWSGMLYTWESLVVSFLTSNCRASRHSFNLSISPLASCISSSFPLFFSAPKTTWDLKGCSSDSCNFLSLLDSCWNKKVLLIKWKWNIIKIMWCHNA